jgi:hypothetical protein
MATQIEKTLFPAPKGLALANIDEPTIEIEVVDDETPEGMQEDGSMIVDLEPNRPAREAPDSTEFGANLAESLDAGTLASMASDVEELIDNDKRSRADWEKTYKDGLALLGLKIEERTEPWEGACGIVHPMITEAVVRFQAETTTETFPASGPARSKIVGKETPKKKEQAARVEADMNHLLTEGMPEFRPEHERMLWELPAVGCSFKKVYYDDAAKRPVSMFVSAEDVLIPYGTTNIFTCTRVTHVMRKTREELVRLMESGFYRWVELDDPQQEMDDVKQAKDREAGLDALNDDRFIIYESHVDLVVEGDSQRKSGSKVAYPYIFTFIKSSNTQILGLRRNWREDDPTFAKRQHFVQYDYVPGFGAYGYGLFHLIGGYAKGATAILRQLVDSGTLANLPGGLKARGLRIKGDDNPIAPGEWRDVDVGSGTISDNIMPLPYKEPSATLAAILDKIVEDARRFAATADMQVSDMSAQAPVGTTLAILERQLKVLTAVQARVHYSLKNELKLLKEIVADYMPGDYTYDPVSGTRGDKKGDYEAVDIIPVSDPNAATLSQRVVQYQAAIQMAQMAPEIYDLPQLHRDMLETLGFKNAAKIIPLDEDMKPMDPVTENMALLQSKPVKAFIYQDHMAHIAVHQAAMQDPMIQQMMGQNPKAPMMMAAATAHIAEHVAYLHRQQIEAQLGMTLPPHSETLPPQIEATLSGMMAQAAQQVLQQNTAIAAQQAAQAAAQDPLLALQREELEVKKQEAQTKEKKVLADAAARADELRIKEMEVTGKLELEGIKVHTDQQEAITTIEANAQQMGMKIGADIGKARHDAQIKEKQAENDRQLAIADQEHRHRMEQSAHELSTRQALSGESLAREKMDREDRRAGEDMQFRREESARNANLKREDGARQQQLGEKKLTIEEKRAAQQSKMAAAKKTAKSPAKKPPKK